jgi:hypothetical protein
MRKLGDGMNYSFNIVGVSPILHFFNHQYSNQEKPQQTGVEYIGTYKCTLDSLLESLEEVQTKCGWNQDEVVDSVVRFWVNNPESVLYWRERLSDAGRDSLLVGRVADMNGLRSELESFLG